MKQLNIVCKECGKILRSRTFKGDVRLAEAMPKVIEVPPCKVCVDKAKLEALFEKAESHKEKE